MKDPHLDQLKRVIETQHGGSAAFAQSVQLLKPGRDAHAWDGTVHVFDVKNNAAAKRAYAWATPIEGSTKPRYFAVLHGGKVTGPVEAVKAAADAIRKWGKPGGGK
jgi:hypothetical protein